MKEIQPPNTTPSKVLGRLIRWQAIAIAIKGAAGSVSGDEGQRGGSPIWDDQGSRPAPGAMP